MVAKDDSIHFRKDESLDRLAETVNVAQFVSFSPDSAFSLTQEYSRVLGFSPNHKFASLREAIQVLINGSRDGSINVRSFLPNDPRSHEFIYGLTTVEAAEQAVHRLVGQRFYVIINETIDVNDGGVSGVVQGGVMEFSPDDTPRCVEKPGVASLPTAWGKAILETVYGCSLALDLDSTYRLEFSVHPQPCGWKRSHILGWELEKVGETDIAPSLVWPNNFSRLIGDKAFGLLVAAEAGLAVPRTTVIGRRVAPFTFGEDTGSVERWIRTCPSEQVPGKYTTHHGWLDPFALLAKEDPDGTNISSVLAQFAVRAEFSGALIVDVDGNPIVEGTKGEGEALMLGTAHPEALPTSVVKDVLELYFSAFDRLGAVRFEWVHDGQQPWIVQLHRGATTSSAKTIVPGGAIWRRFEVSNGLANLRAELDSLKPGEGILLVGHVGLTSHFADVLRKSKRPSRIE